MFAPRRINLTLLLAAVLLAPRVQAQVATLQQQAAPVREESGDDPLGRSTPHGTVLGFIKAAQRGDYDQAASYLDTRQQGELARKLAQQLQVILDRETSIDLRKLSRQTQGSLANPQNPNRDLVGVARTSGGDVEIRLDRVQRGDSPPIWLFSRDTLRLVPELYEDVGQSSEVERYLPALLKASFLSLPVWELCLIVLSVPLVLFLGSLAVRLFKAVLALLGRGVLPASDVAQAQILVAPLRLILFGVLFVISASLSRSLLGRNVGQGLGIVVTVVGVTWFALRAVTIAGDLGLARLKRIQSSDKIALARLLSRLSQIGVVIIGALVVLYLAGVNLTAAMTGLGIGGVAVALAAQKTLENLFGGIMIISDRPVRIGDVCKIGDITGTIVDIGLRSTRIRTQERTIVTVPNGQLAAMNLENYTLRDKFAFHPTISLSYQTTVVQLREVLRKIRELLDKNGNVESQSAWARLVRIGNASQDIEIFAYVFAADNNVFLGVQEQLLMLIMETVESTGTAFALPAQVTQITPSTSHSESTARASRTTTSNSS